MVEVPFAFLQNPQKKQNIVQYKLAESLQKKAILGLALAKYRKYDDIAIKIIKRQLGIKKKKIYIYIKNSNQEREKTSQIILWDEKYYHFTKDGCSVSIKLKDPIDFMKIKIPFRGK